MTFLRAASVGLLLSVAACGSVTSETEVDGQQYIIPSPGGDCDEFGCGMNSPEVDNLGVHDLFGDPALGLKNYNGFWVSKVEKAAVTYKRIFANRAELYLENGAGVITSATAGTIIRVKHSSGIEYEVKILAIGRHSFWGHITGGEVGVSYEIGWKTVSGGGDQKGYKNVCRKPPNDGAPELMGMPRFQAVVFEDDNITAHEKTIKQRPASERSWFNIGCAGHALAKLHLTGYTTGAQHRYPGYSTSNNERQATLKMITADYCGTGYAFTVAGQPLEWTDLIWNGYTLGFAGKKESEWNERGAVCLNKPRLIANPPAVMPWPMLMDDIKTECSGAPPPECADTDPYLLAGGNTMISSNP